LCFANQSARGVAGPRHACKRQGHGGWTVTGQRKASAGHRLKLSRDDRHVPPNWPRAAMRKRLGCAGQRSQTWHECLRGAVPRAVLGSADVRRPGDARADVRAAEQTGVACGRRRTMTDRDEPKAVTGPYGAPLRAPLRPRSGLHERRPVRGHPARSAARAAVPLRDAGAPARRGDAPARRASEPRAHVSGRPHQPASPETG
jgi:hypothetical protein